MFTCTADDAGGIGATVFIVNGDTAGRCLVRHDMVTPSVLTCGPGGAFIAANESVNGITYTSLLTVTAIEELNGTTVQCLSGAVVNSVSLHVIGTYTTIHITVFFQKFGTSSFSAPFH